MVDPEPTIFTIRTGTETDKNINEEIVAGVYHGRTRICLASFPPHAGCQTQLMGRRSADGAGRGTDESAHGVARDDIASEEM